MKPDQYSIDTAISKGSSSSMEGLNEDPSEMSLACGGVMGATVDVVESSPLLVTVEGLVFVKDSISVVEFTSLRSIGKLTLRSVVSLSVTGTMVEMFSLSDTASLRFSAPETGTSCKFVSAMAPLATWNTATRNKTFLRNIMIMV